MAINTKGLPLNILIAMVIFAIAGLATVFFIPGYNFSSILGWTSIGEWRLKLGVTAYILVVLTALFFWFVKKSLGLKVSWFIYSLIYSSLTIITKFVFSAATYRNINSNIPLIGLSVGGLYLLGICTIYLFFEGNFFKSLKEVSKKSEELKFIFAAVLFIFVDFIRILIFSFTPLSKTSAASYLNSVFKGEGFALSIFLFLIIISAVEAFDKAKNSLKSVFLLASYLMIMYHILWIGFVYSMIKVGGF
ncbi:MAG: hypothetical protein M3Y85_13215 [Bacteroidota bacterium]|nr:hypothetical protein [Bacteroidota bacterium]